MSQRTLNPTRMMKNKGGHGLTDGTAQDIPLLIGDRHGDDRVH